MALKPGTIKALFGKLAGQYGDDIVEGVAKYGDDVVGATAPYVDDVAEDTTRLLNYYNNNAKWSTHPYIYGKYVDNPVLNQALQASTGYVDNIPVIRQADSGVLKKMSDYALWGNDLGSGLPTGNARSNLYNALETATDAAPESIKGTSGFIEEFGRPHKNTALGRWFKRTYGIEVD
jgi:hypothetical protein